MKSLLPNTRLVIRIALLFPEGVKLWMIGELWLNDKMVADEWMLVVGCGFGVLVRFYLFKFRVFKKRTDFHRMIRITNWSSIHSTQYPIR